MRSIPVLLVLLSVLSAESAEAQVTATPVDTVWVQPSARARGIAFSPDGAYVASNGSASPGFGPNLGRVALWNAGDGALVAEADGNALLSRIGRGNGVVFSAGSDRLATAHGTVTCGGQSCSASFPQLALWTVPDLGVAVFREFGGMIPTDLDLSPDGLQIAAGYTYDNAGAIRFHDPATLVSQVLLPGHRYATYGVVFSPDGSLLASVGDETVARVWNAFTGELIRTLEHESGPNSLSQPRSVAFSPDGARLVTALGENGPNGGMVSVWRVTDGARLLEIDVRNLPDVSTTNTLVQVSPNGAYVIAAVTEEFSPTPGTYRTTTRLRLYDIDTGTLVADYDAGTVENIRIGGFSDLALSPGQDYRIAYSLRGSLAVIDTAPLRMASTPIVAGVPTPDAQAALRPTGPNPFRSETTLALDVAEAADVRAEVFDALGRRMAVLYDGPAAPGQTVPLRVDASRWPAGVYTVRVTGAGVGLQRTLTVVR